MTEAEVYRILNKYDKERQINVLKAHWHLLALEGILFGGWKILPKFVFLAIFKPAEAKRRFENITNGLYAAHLRKPQGESK